MSVRTVQLGEVCDFFYGDSLKEERRRPGKVPVFGSNGIVGWHDQAITNGPTIVIGRKGSIGEINWSKEPCFPIDTTYYVEKTKLPCDLRWLYFTLQKLDLTRLNKSAAIPGLNREDAYEQRIPWPDLSEQKRIAGLLERADRLRHTRRYALELSTSFLPSAFLQLFGNPIKNPAGFRTERLEELIDPNRQISYGILMPGPNLPEGVPYIRVTDIQNGQVVTANIRRTTKEMDQAYKRSRLKAGDLLLTIRGHVGRMAIVPISLEGANITQDTARLAPRKDVKAHYLMGCLGSDGMQRWMADVTRGAAVQGINLGDVKELPIPVPPMALQSKFVSLVVHANRLRSTQLEGLRQADHLFQSLLHRAFSEESDA